MPRCHPFQLTDTPKKGHLVARENFGSLCLPHHVIRVTSGVQALAVMPSRTVRQSRVLNRGRPAGHSFERSTQVKPASRPTKMKMTVVMLTRSRAGAAVSLPYTPHASPSLTKSTGFLERMDTSLTSWLANRVTTHPKETGL